MNIDKLVFGQNGLIPVVTQDFETKEVLMLAYMNKTALEKTIETGKIHYFSRSRQALWLKGETSGNFQLVKNIAYDCDGDALLILAEQQGGAACHTGHKSCFYTNIDGVKNADVVLDPAIMYKKTDVLSGLLEVIADRRENPKEGSYTNYLFDKGIDKMLKKVGEEAAEVIIASKNNEKSEMQYEISDLMYHLSVVMANGGLTWDDIYEELKRRGE